MAKQLSLITDFLFSLTIVVHNILDCIVMKHFVQNANILNVVFHIIFQDGHLYLQSIKLLTDVLEVFRDLS